MSDQNEKNLNQPEDGQDDFSSMSIDDLIASTKEEIARIDQMMGTSRLPQQEDAQEPAPQQGAPQAGEVSLDNETDDKANPSQSEPFEPKLPEEYADLSLDSDEQPEQDEQPQRAHLAAGVKVLLYVCCVLAASVLLAVFGWRLADDVLALTKPDEEITITVPENATVADVSRELKEKGLIEYEWLFRFYCRVRVLCSRSAILIRMTRMSLDIAMNILRRFSICCSSVVEYCTRVSFVTPSTSSATVCPNMWEISSKLASVSSRQSCSSAATIASVSRPISATISATASG